MSTTSGNSPDYVQKYTITYIGSIDYGATSAAAETDYMKLQQSVEMYLKGVLTNVNFGQAYGGSATVNFTVEALKELLAVVFSVAEKQHALHMMELEGFKLPQHTFKIHVRDVSPSHTRFAIFAGPVEGSRGLCGELCMRNDEFEEFKKVLEFKRGDETISPVIEATGVKNDGLEL